MIFVHKSKNVATGSRGRVSRKSQWHGIGFEKVRAWVEKKPLPDLVLAARGGRFCRYPHLNRAAPDHTAIWPRGFAHTSTFAYTRIFAYTSPIGYAGPNSGWDSFGSIHQRGPDFLAMERH
jgi:hypothetical protein